MSHAKNILLAGLLVALAAGCTPQDETAATPAASTPAGTPAAAAPAKPAKAQLPQVLTADQIAESRLPLRSSCNIEMVNNVRLTNEPLLAPAKVISFSGWLLPEISKKTGVKAEIRLLDPTGTAGWYYVINHWTPRPDVNAAMKGADNGNAGFSQAANLSSLPPGTYKVLVTFRDGARYVCDNGRQLQIQ